ncbi:hypothetical protein [Streptomyces sp. GC420]|uniref:hypothetical protein n=1 Tax=Streptomyces sp. GC420 TaxID=2697568 RepID=UPI001414CFC2|nr:hypothetical protein [Streptomyces sp. GC420]NBM19897.1 hypothetical protein [Streptomyces sp. GC420]
MLQAWDEHVPVHVAAGDEVRAAVSGDLDAIDRPAGEPMAAPTAPSAEGADRPGPTTQDAADAVNAALRELDEHAGGITHHPDWQRLQTVRGAARHLWDTLREKAGAH